ncbi:MAG: hypothetical protein ACFCVF_14420 [Kineosporiaceae bacterium]
MTVIEIIFSTPGSEGDYDSRVVECDSWNWGARVEVHRGGAVVAQFAGDAVLGVVDLTALAEVDEDEDEDDEEENDLDEDIEDDEPEVPPVPSSTAS